MTTENKDLKIVAQDAKRTLPATAENPFLQKKSEHLMHGAVQIEESRAIAEAQGKLIIAKKFPRDEAAAFEQMMNSCSRMGLASVAIFSYPRGGKTISGASIRFAEELARAWGNIDFGIRELSQQPGLSELEAYCWDLQTNTSSSMKFTVKHERHTREGVTILTDPRDIFELIANQGSRRLRARILAVLPPDLTEAALDRCRQTLIGKSAEPLADRIKKMIVAFSNYGVTKAHIETFAKVKVDEMLPEKLADLISVYNSIKDGATKPSEWFGKDAEVAPDAIAALSEEGSIGKAKTTRTAKKNEATAPAAEEAGPKNEPVKTEVKAEAPVAPVEKQAAKPEPKVDTKKTPPGSPASPAAKEKVPAPPAPEQPATEEDELPDALFPEEDLV